MRASPQFHHFVSFQVEAEFKTKNKINPKKNQFFIGILLFLPL